MYLVQRRIGTSRYCTIVGGWYDDDLCYFDRWILLNSTKPLASFFSSSCASLKKQLHTYSMMILIIR